MSELSKQALKVQNNTEFPNNNAGLITPSKLRGFNTDMIDSLVDEISYNVDSASWNQQIDSLEAATASMNAYTQSNDQKWSTLQSFTASITASVQELLNLSSSLSGGYVTQGELADATGSLINSINTKLNTASFNAYTASSNSSITNLNSATASLFTSASLSLTTASFNNGTRNLTFNKGDGTTFAVNIPDVSGSVGNFVTTSSFNSYTASTDSSISQLNASSASQQISINALNVFTASQSTGSIVSSIDNLNTFSASALVSISNLNSTTASLNTSVTNLNSATSSLFTSASLGLTTASFASQTLTFTKGDGSTFGIVIPDVSGSTIDTGSFATTASFNSYTASNDQKVNSLIAATGSFATTGSNTFTGNQTISHSGGGQFILADDSGINVSYGQTGLGNFEITQSGSVIMRGNDASGNGSFNIFWVPTFINGINPAGLPFATTGSNTFNGNQIVSGAVDIQNSLSASLPQGYVWVGDASNRTVVFPTSSFGSTLPSGVISGSQQITDLGFVSSSITGSSLVTASVAVNVITFTKGDSSTFDITVSASGSVTPGTISGSQQITDLGFVSSSVTASSLVTASFSGNTLTFTKGDASTFGIVIPDVSGSGTAFANPSLESISGSLLITANTFNSGAANLLHLTASEQNQSNLVFKNNNNQGTTIISGSNNIFTNPTIPAAGRINYIGGASNLFLNGQSQQLPTITGSAASVSGARPTMNANINAGTNAWTINQSVNPGSHTYSNNILAGNANLTFNMLGNTGTVQFTGNLALSPSLTLNSPSRSIAQINAGVSGSNQLTITNNTIAGTFNYQGPVSSSTHLITANTIAGVLTMNAQSQSRALTVNQNNINGNFTLTDFTVFAPTLGSSNTFTNNNINGVAIFRNQASASFQATGNILNGVTITNDHDASGIATAAQRLLSVTGNIVFGSLNYIYASGSQGAVANRRGALYNLIGGENISASLVGDGQSKSIIATTILGNGLNVSGSSITFAGIDYGSAFFGRFNAEDGNRAKTAETIFAVGTGTTGSIRKTGFLIDSGSNTFIEGTLNVSGATSLNGDLIITGSLTASLATGYTYVGNSSGLTEAVPTSSIIAETASLAINAKDIIVDVKNTTGAQINKGTVVRIIGATGDNPLIGTASWEDDNNSANTLGFVVADIANDAFGRVMTQGTLLGIDTDPALGYAAGDIIYLSSSGQYTKVIPPAPYHEVRLGQVLRAQQNNGSVYVLIQNGYELTELHDVDINTGSLANNDLLAWNSSSAQWVNKTVTGVGGLTTASFNTATGSFITTGSVAGNVLTFTKGDSSTFTLTVATGSGGGGSTFPYTGNAVITGSLGVSGSMFGGVVALSVVSSTASVDFSAANLFTLTLPSASTHINPTNIRAGQTVNIQITQPTPGTGSVTFPSNVKFAGGNDYQATATGSAIDMLTLVSYDGSNVLGTSIKNFL